MHGLLIRAVVVGVALLSVGCDRTKTKVVHRDNCLVCHEPRNEAGIPEGIAAAHPWEPLTCVECHGGEPRICDGTLGGTDEDPTCDGEWVYDKDRAHVLPGDGPEFLRNLTAAELDAVDPDYLRFINPGDMRVLESTCGRCHMDVTFRVRNSTMAHTSGELTVARYRAGGQDDPRGVFGAIDLVDSDPNPPCGVDELVQLNPPAMDLASTEPSTELTVSNAQDQYIVKSCLRCHLNDFGENRFAGDFRSSGCTACHMYYEDDGLSASRDPRISRETVPHPRTHQLSTNTGIQQCTHCHYRGGRIGISYQGYRESAGAGLNPERPEVLGVALHGHDAAYYITDEDSENDYDETPADVHFEAGMDCVDCHYEEEVHGDGHLYADTQCAVGTECEDCHGSVREYATPAPWRDNFYERDGRFYLMTRVTQVELEVPQVRDSITPGNERYTEEAEAAMGVNSEGYSHTDDLECYTCHSGWIPTCYGCHVDMDMAVDSRYQSTGELVAGRPTGRRRWVSLFDLVLIRNSDGLMAPSMPAERLFLTVHDGDTPTEIHGKPRVFTRPDGTQMPGFGQRAFNPHTVQRVSPFMSCDRCHSVGSVESPSNEVLLDLTHGFGTQRFMQDGCDITNADPTCDPETDWTTYALDAVIERDGEPLVIVGHPDPVESRPLTIEEIDRMRAILVDDSYLPTPIPADAATNVNWPAARRIEPAR